MKNISSFIVFFIYIYAIDYLGAMISFGIQKYIKKDKYLKNIKFKKNWKEEYYKEKYQSPHSWEIDT